MNDPGKTNSDHNKILHDLFVSIEYIISGVSSITETVACDNRLFIIQNNIDQPTVLLMYNDSRKIEDSIQRPSKVSYKIKKNLKTNHQNESLSVMSEDSQDSVKSEIFVSNYVEAVYGTTNQNEGANEQNSLESHIREFYSNTDFNINDTQEGFSNFRNYFKDGEHPAFCEVSSRKRDKFKSKLLSHDCRICGMTFETLLLKNHHEQAVHSVLKPYACRYCSKRFMKYDYKQKHERIHRGEKPFKCQYCGKVFIQACDKVLHERIHTGHRPFKCAYCPKTFIRISRKNIHERLHTGEKPYCCRYCDRRFFSSTSRNYHERIHTGLKPYKCDFCNKGFTRRQQKELHEMKHTGQTPFKCDFCDKTFLRLERKLEHESITHIVQT